MESNLSELIASLKEGIFVLTWHPKKLFPDEEFEWTARMGLYETKGNTPEEAISKLVKEVV